MVSHMVDANCSDFAKWRNMPYPEQNLTVERPLSNLSHNDRPSVDSVLRPAINQRRTINAHEKAQLPLSSLLSPDTDFGHSDSVQV